MLPIVSRSQGPVGNDVLFQNRVVAPDGTGTSVTFESNCITAADVSSIACTVYDVDSGDLDSQGTAVPITTAAILALAIPNEWQNKDTVGRNFRHQVAGSYFSQPDHTYRVVYAITTAAGTKLQWAHEHTATSLVPS